MGYETILSRQFIKLDNERFLPIVNSRLSNTTTLNSNGREVYTQSQYPLYIGKGLLTTLKEIEEVLEAEVMDYVERRKDSVHYSDEEKTEAYVRENLGWLKVFFVGSNRYMSQKQMNTWFKSGLKRALTIEEFRQMGGHITLVNHKTKDTICIKTTDELLKFVDNGEIGNYYFRIGGYDYAQSSIRKTNYFKTNDKKEVDKYFVIETEVNSYLLTRKRKYYVSNYVNMAKKFKTESEANRYLKNYLKKHTTFYNFEVKQINEKATI